MKKHANSESAGSRRDRRSNKVSHSALFVLLAPSAVIVTFLVLCARNGLYSVPDSESVATSITETSSPDRDSVDRAIHSAAAYLRAQLRDDGQFKYRVNLNDEIVIPPRYNVLRHAGAIYALGMYNEVFPKSETATAMMSAGNFLQRQIAPLPGRPHLSAIWSRHDVENSFEPDQAKLGGTGLGLVALLSVEKVRPGATDSETLRKLGEFLLYMQKSDGSFYSKYVPDEGGFSNWDSLYYPGEAALGLIMLHDRYPDEKWLRAAADALEYLAKARKGQIDVPHDHWALLATARIWPHLDLEKQQPLRARLADHAAQICRSITDGQSSLRSDFLRGSFDEEGRITPCATRLEGLQAADLHLPLREAALSRQVVKACDLGTWFLLRAQIKEGPFAGGFPRSIWGHPNFAPDSLALLNPRSSEIRIDYVQHALSALLEFRERSNQ